MFLGHIGERHAGAPSCTHCSSAQLGPKNIGQLRGFKPDLQILMVRSFCRKNPCHHVGVSIGKAYINGWFRGTMGYPYFRNPPCLSFFLCKAQVTSRFGRPRVSVSTQASFPARALWPTACRHCFDKLRLQCQRRCWTFKLACHLFGQRLTLW